MKETMKKFFALVVLTMLTSCSFFNYKSRQEALLACKNWENENLLENNLPALRNFISIIKTEKKSRRIQKGIHSADINFFDKKIYHLQQRLAVIEGTLVHASEKNVPVAKKIKRYFIKKSTSVYKRLFAKHYKKIK